MHPHHPKQRHPRRLRWRDGHTNFCLLVLATAALLAACSSSSNKPTECLVGQTLPCACLGGEMSGVQTCQADGKSLGSCICPDGSSGPGGASGSGGTQQAGASGGQAGGAAMTNGAGGSSSNSAGSGGRNSASTAAASGGASAGGAGPGSAGSGGMGPSSSSTGTSGGGSPLACKQQAPKPSTGQRCPLFSPCQNSSDCGQSQGCQQWFCYQSTCSLNPLSNCGTTAGGNCQADVVLSHHVAPPVEKDFLAPDGFQFRELGSLVFTVTNNTQDSLHLKQVPLAIDVAGGGSKFDVDALKMFWDSGGAEHQPGDLLACSEPKPFSFPASGKLSTGCGSSPHTDIAPNGGSKRFLINIAFEKSKTNIAGRSYRLRLASSAGLLFTVGKNGPLFSKSICGVGPQGFVGAWLHAK